MPNSSSPVAFYTQMNFFFVYHALYFNKHLQIEAKSFLAQKFFMISIELKFNYRTISQQFH